MILAAATAAFFVTGLLAPGSFNPLMHTFALACAAAFGFSLSLTIARRRRERDGRNEAPRSPAHAP